MTACGNQLCESLEIYSNIYTFIEIAFSEADVLVAVKHIVISTDQGGTKGGANINSTNISAMSGENLSSGFVTRVVSNWPAQPQKI